MAITFQKVEQVLHFKEEKPTVYKIAQQTLPPVKFLEFVTEVSASCGVNASMTRAVAEGLIDRLIHYMALGHAVQLGDFGTFKTVFTSKTRKTLEEVSVKDVKVTKIRFYPGQRFKQMLKNLSIVQLDSLENVVTESDSNSSGSGGESSESGDNPLV